MQKWKRKNENRVNMARKTVLIAYAFTVSLSVIFLEPYSHTQGKACKYLDTC